MTKKVPFAVRKKKSKILQIKESSTSQRSTSHYFTRVMTPTFRPLDLLRMKDKLVVIIHE